MRYALVLPYPSGLVEVHYLINRYKEFRLRNVHISYTFLENRKFIYIRVHAMNHFAISTKNLHRIQFNFRCSRLKRELANMVNFLLCWRNSTWHMRLHGKTRCNNLE